MFLSSSITAQLSVEDPVVVTPLAVASKEQNPVEVTPLAVASKEQNPVEVTPLAVASKEQNNHELNSTHSINRKGKIDWTDDIFVRKGWDNDPIVIESHKLLFFTVPKNACTTFKRLFRRMLGYENWLKVSAHDPAKNGLKYLGKYSREQQEEFMTSPSWTRAIFVRDPLERTLSAYMDKALKTTYHYWKPPVNGAYIKRICCNMLPKSNKTSVSFDSCKAPPLWPYKTNLTIDNFPFETFVKEMLVKCSDPHWRPQYKRMSIRNWKYINFVGRFENKKADTHRLLKKIGAFEEFGASGWGEDENGNLTLPIFGSNLAPHATDSGTKMSKHYTDEVRKLVFKYYRMDYTLKLFNFTRPKLPPTS